MVFSVCSDFLKYHQQYDGQTANKISTGWSQTWTVRIFFSFSKLD